MGLTALAILLAVVAFVLPIVLLVMVSDMRARMDRSDARLLSTGDALRRITDELAIVRGERPAPRDVLGAAMLTPPSAAPPTRAPEPSAFTPSEPTVSPQTAPTDRPASTQEGRPPATSVPPIAAVSAPIAPLPVAAAATASFEERLGTRWAVWLGGVALALGAVLLVHYSIERGFFGPGFRTLMGGLFALALVAGGEWLRRSERRLPIEIVPGAHIPSLLTAAGTIAAFATIWAAYALYGFIGPLTAFVLLGATGIATMFAAAIHGPALAGLGLVGAFAAPLLVSTAHPNMGGLALYFAVVAASAYTLALTRNWLWLAMATGSAAVVMTFPFLERMHVVGEPLWTVAGYGHGLIQLALAALAFAVVPHGTLQSGSDSQGARPDGIASLALLALSAATATLLIAGRGEDALFVPATLAAVAILLTTAWRSAPAAAAMGLAGVVALAALLTWPGLKAPAETLLLWPAVAAIIRLPENVTGFLLFAAVLALGILAVSTERVRRAPHLPQSTTGFLLLGAVVTPLLVLVFAYLRVTQFDTSIPFAAFAVALGGLFLWLTSLFLGPNTAIAPAPGAVDRSPAHTLAAGAFATGVAAAVALAFACSLDRGYLTVAFAVVAFSTALIAARLDLRLLRIVVVAIGLIVLARLAWNPRIVGGALGSTPIFNWLLLGYGVPALAFLAAARILRRTADDLATRLSDALGVLFAMLLFVFEIRHALYNGSISAAVDGHVEPGLMATVSLGMSYVLSRADLARGNVVFRIASLMFGVASAVIAALALALFSNPFLTSDRVTGVPVFSSLLLAYLLPGIIAAIAARASRGVRPQWYVTGASVLALGLVFAYVTFEVRHLFQGEHIAFWHQTSAAEVWSYSAIWLALGLAFLAYGLLRGAIEARIASAALVLITVLKVFLFDLSGISGLWRALSFILLGLVLMGIGLVYQRLIFARPRAIPLAAPDPIQPLVT